MMKEGSRRGAILALGTAVVAAGMLFAGCGDSTSPTGAGSGSDFIGTWLEDRSAAPEVQGRGQVQITPTSPNLRQLTFAADNTFKMTICKKDGSPVAGVKEVTGTWKIEEDILFFEGAEGQLSGKYDRWEPEIFNKKSTGPDGNPQMEILHRNSERVVYRKTGG